MKLLAVVLEAIFVAAKLAGVINWSWWLVLAPIWVYIGLEVVRQDELDDYVLNEYPSCLRTSMLDYIELVFNYRGAKFNLDYVYPWEVFSKDFY